MSCVVHRLCHLLTAMLHHSLFQCAYVQDNKNNKDDNKDNKDNKNNKDDNKDNKNNKDDNKDNKDKEIKNSGRMLLLFQLHCNCLCQYRRTCFSVCRLVPLTMYIVPHVSHNAKVFRLVVPTPTFPRQLSRLWWQWRLWVGTILRYQVLDRRVR